MKPTICSFGFALTEGIEQRVRQRAAAAIQGLDNVVLDLVVRLRDVNGPRGGVDKNCQIVAQLRYHGQVVANGLHPDLYVAIDQAAARLRDLICRRLARRRSPRQDFQRRLRWEVSGV